MTSKEYKILHKTGMPGMGCSCCRKGIKAKYRRTARAGVKADTRKEVREWA